MTIITIMQITAFIAISLSGFAIGLYLGNRTGLRMAVDMIVEVTNAEYEEEEEEE